MALETLQSTWTQANLVIHDLKRSNRFHETQELFTLMETQIESPHCVLKHTKK